MVDARDHFLACETYVTIELKRRFHDELSFVIHPNNANISKLMSPKTRQCVWVFPSDTYDLQFNFMLSLKYFAHDAITAVFLLSQLYHVPHSNAASFTTGKHELVKGGRCGLAKNALQCRRISSRKRGTTENGRRQFSSHKR